MRHTISRSLLVIISLTLDGCNTLPTGPSVLVLPGAHQNFAKFTQDDGFCRQYALFQVGGTSPQASAAQTGAGAAAAGTAIGAASGAAIGGGYGAAVGAGAGLAGGSVVGTGMGYQSGYATQQRYDQAYIQCMYGHGHQVPISGVITHPPTEPSRKNVPNSDTGGIPLPPMQSQPQGDNGSLPLPPR